MSRRESRSASASTAPRKLRSYARMRRREDGFDLSGPEKPWGEYTPYKGGSYYFNAYQDRQASRVLQQYPQKTGQEGAREWNADEPYRGSRTRRTTLADDIKETVQRDSDHLLLTVARLLIDESCVRAEPVATTPQRSSDSGINGGSGRRSKRKTLTPQNNTSSRPASAWKGRGTRKSVSSLSLTGSISSVPATPSHSALQDIKKSSLHSTSGENRSALTAGPTSHRGVQLADRSSSLPVQQPVTPRPSTACITSRRSTGRRSSTPVLQPAVSNPQPRYTHRHPVPSSSSTPSPPPDNPLHSTSIQTRNDVQDAGTNTDVETRSISTQTTVDSDTQTELSYLMGRRPPLLPLSESNSAERINPPTPPSFSVAARPSADQLSQGDDTTLRVSMEGSAISNHTITEKENKEEFQGLEENAKVAEQLQEEAGRDINEHKVKAAEERVKRAEEKVMEAEKELRKAEDELKEADEALQEVDDETKAADKATTEAEEDVTAEELQKEEEEVTAAEEHTEADTKEAETGLREEHTESDTKEAETGLREEVTEARSRETEADMREEETEAGVQEVVVETREELQAEENKVKAKESGDTEEHLKEAKEATNNREANLASRSNSEAAAEHDQDFSYSAMPPTPPPRDPELYTDYTAQAIKEGNPNQDKFWESD